MELKAENKNNLYENMGDPAKSITGAWISGIQDPATDPKWIRKQRMERLFRRFLKLGFAGLLLGLGGAVVYGAHRRRKT